jgi:hypothetical protein
MASGKFLRLGYRDPTAGLDSGLGITSPTPPTASTLWRTDVPLLAHHGRYASLTVNGSRFISLAPRTKDGSLDLVTWSLSGPATLYKALDDEHNVPRFGPLAETLNAKKGIYVAGVVHNGATTRQDRWAIVVATLADGAVNTLMLQPKLIAEIDSIAGLGIAN